MSRADHHRDRQRVRRHFGMCAGQAHLRMARRTCGCQASHLRLVVGQLGLAFTERLQGPLQGSGGGAVALPETLSLLL